MNVLFAASAIYSGLVTAPGVRDIVQTNFEDASFTAKVVKGVQTELRKINKDFAQSYRFKSSEVMLQEPFKLRMESKVDDSSIIFILNGTKRNVRVPRSKVNFQENLSEDPGKRQTVFDFGILTPSLFNDFLVATFIREDRSTKDWVFDITYASRYNYSVRHRVWVDPLKKYTVKREWYGRDGRLMATFLYDEPKNYKNVWLPTRLTVRNAEDKLAGVTEYKDVKVNTGLSDNLFKVSR